MHPKVSVIVAVYNPGTNIDGLIDSLAGQTLPADELEVLFVDDGSTDGTGERLEQVVASRPTWSVTTIPNSGWPGRPRNRGMDLATGDYVFFADHDDEFLPEALERMHALARANGSDIVYPKLVRVGRTTPYWSLAHRTVAVADPLGDVLSSRTVHKLYRREFLTACGARFPEGRVRLEDHNFTSQVLPHASVVSVLADYPCYTWIHRSDASNSSETPSDADVYWGHYTQAVRVMEREAGPGPLLDAARVVAMVQAYSRFSPAAYLKLSDEERLLLFDAVHAYVVEQFPASLDSRLPVLKRLRTQPLRSGDRARFEAVQRQRTELSFHVELTEARWDAERLHVAVRLTLNHREGGPYELERWGDDVAMPLADQGSDTSPAEGRVLLPEDRGTAEITVRHLRTGVEWPVATAQRHELVPVGNGVGLQVHAEADIDPAHGYFGTPLEDGTWSLVVRAQFLGESLVMAVPDSEGVTLPAAPHSVSGRTAAVLRTGRGGLALRVPADLDDVVLASELPSVVRAQWRDGDLGLLIAIPGGSPEQWLCVRIRGNEDGRRVPVHDGSATITMGWTAPGDIVDFYVRAGSAQQPGPERRLRFGEAEVHDLAPYRVYRTETGSFSVKHVRTTAPSRPTSPRGLAASARSRLRGARNRWLDRARRP